MTQRRGAPLYAVALILSGWAAGRAIILYQPAGLESRIALAKPPSAQDARSAAAPPISGVVLSPALPSIARWPSVPVTPVAPPRAVRPVVGKLVEAMRRVDLTPAVGTQPGGLSTENRPASAQPDIYRPQPSSIGIGRSAGPRPSLSAWLHWRPDASPNALVSAGQLGGSQVGFRAFVPIATFGNNAQIGGAARLSAPLAQGRGKEASLGISWRQAGALPVEVVAERRVALDRGGRNAFGVFAATGVSDREIGPGLLVNAYAQAGVVGIRSRDGFADGAATLEIPVYRSQRYSLQLGGGIWGAIQPGIARLDTGPQMTLRLTGGQTPLRVSAQWRFRVVGAARPASGPAITIGTDF
jgi:hypothetical protein